MERMILKGWELNGQGQSQSHIAIETVWAQGRWNKQKWYMQAQSSDKASTCYQAMGLSIWVENMEMEEP